MSQEDFSVSGGEINFTLEDFLSPVRVNDDFLQSSTHPNTPNFDQGSIFDQDPSPTQNGIEEVMVSPLPQKKKRDDQNTVRTLLRRILRIISRAYKIQ